MTPEQLFLLALLALIMTNIVAPIFQWITSAEQRRRDLEDRKLVVQAAKEATEAAAAAAKEAASALGVVHAAVTEVGIKADASYKEANNANLKIQAVQNDLAAALNLPKKSITTTTGAKEESEQEKTL